MMNISAVFMLVMLTSVLQAAVVKDDKGDKENLRFKRCIVVQKQSGTSGDSVEAPDGPQYGGGDGGNGGEDGGEYGDYDGDYDYRGAPKPKPKKTQRKFRTGPTKKSSSYKRKTTRKPYDRGQ